jgi:hypothetical protein
MPRKLVIPPVTKRDHEVLIARLPTLETQLIAWIDAVDKDLVHRNLDLRRGGAKVYVRRSDRYLDDRLVITLDVASITIPQKDRGRGWFRNFRRIVEAVNPWDATYYESVLNPRLDSYFRKEGLERDAGGYYVMHRSHSASC